MFLDRFSRLESNFEFYIHLYYSQATQFSYATVFCVGETWLLGDMWETDKYTAVLNRKKNEYWLSCIFWKIVWWRPNCTLYLVKMWGNCLFFFWHYFEIGSLTMWLTLYKKRSAAENRDITKWRQIWMIASHNPQEKHMLNLCLLTWTVEVWENF